MTDRRHTLLSLAERCEREGASYALDVKIAHKIGRTAGQIPCFTTSLDAAMTLVPDGWHWSLTTWSNDPSGSVSAIPRARVFQAIFDFRWTRASTPALALCAAALRALAAMEVGG